MTLNFSNHGNKSVELIFKSGNLNPVHDLLISLQKNDFKNDFEGGKRGIICPAMKAILRNLIRCHLLPV